MLVDAHVHLDGYGDQLSTALEEIDRLEVLTVAVAVDPDTYRVAREASLRSSLVLPAFGVHPWEAHSWVDRLEEVDPLIEDAPMIGEIGLDRRWVEEPERYEPQRAVFSHFLRRAAALDRVINVHTAGAEAECLEAIVAHGCRRVIVHWYSGPLDVLEDMIDAGFYFTVGVELPLSDSIRQVASAIPDEQLLTETDNPGGLKWLTGEVGMPGKIADVVADLARVRGTTQAAIEEIVADNTRRLVDGDDVLEAWAAPLSV